MIKECMKMGKSTISGFDQPQEIMAKLIIPISSKPNPLATEVHGFYYMYPPYSENSNSSNTYEYLVKPRNIILKLLEN